MRKRFKTGARAVGPVAAINDPNRAARLQSQLEKHPPPKEGCPDKGQQNRPGRDESMRSPGFEAEWAKGDSRCKKDRSRGESDQSIEAVSKGFRASRPMPSGPISIPAPTSNRIGGTRIARPPNGSAIPEPPRARGELQNVGRDCVP